MTDWGPTLVNSGTALGGVLLGVWLTRMMSSSERILELRRAAYSTIIAELAELENRLEEIKSYLDEDADRYFTGTGDTAKRRDQDEAFLDAHTAGARTNFRLNYLILSHAFVDRYERMGREIGTAEEDDLHDQLAAHLDFFNAVKSARKDLFNIAMAETSPDRRGWRKYLMGAGERRQS